MRPARMGIIFQQDMNTQRRYIRVSFSSEIWVGQDGSFNRLNGQMDTLSAGGAFLRTSRIFSVNTILDLRFRLSDTSEYICCRAIVRNVTPGEGCGVEFQDVSAEDRHRIRQCVESRALSEVLKNSVFGRTSSLTSHR